MVLTQIVKKQWKMCTALMVFAHFTFEIKGKKLIYSNYGRIYEYLKITAANISPVSTDDNNLLLYS